MPKSQFTCDESGCDMKFPRAYELRKHKDVHQGKKMLYCKWEDCPFYTSSQLNLKVHIRTHTGEQTEECPDTIELTDASGSSYRESCSFKTHDPSLLSRHRQRIHNHKPRPRARPQAATTGTVEFVHYNPPPSPGSTTASMATDDAASRARKPKRVRKRKPALQRSNSSENAGSDSHAVSMAPESRLPCTMQQGADGYGQADMLPPNTSGPSAASFTDFVPIHAQDQAYAERLPVEAAGSSNNRWIALNPVGTHWQPTYEESLPYTGSGIAPIIRGQPQGHVPFNAATNFQGPWPTFGAEMYTTPFMTEAYGHNHVANAQMQMNTLPTTNGLNMYFSDDYQLWDASQAQPPYSF